MKEILKNKLEILNSDEKMMEALAYVLTETVEKQKPEIHNEDDNFKIGEKYRAYIKAKEILTEFFKDIEIYKDNKSNPKSFDKGK